MYLRQYYLDCLAHASYMIADPASREAAVVDPRRDIDIYVEDARKHGFEIRHVILTHFHADFLAGHLELRERAGARIHLGRKSRAEFDFNALGEGDLLRLGPEVTIRVLETPGHTPEGISLLVFDRARSADKPHAVLTGDTLFIGDVGRPDLLVSAGFSEKELAGMLYESLRYKLLPLPDETLVYPAHGAGSACGRNLSSETVSTLGEQRRTNYALQPMTREEFTRIVTAPRSPAPAYFSYDAKLNKQERRTLEDYLEEALRPLELHEVISLANHGAQIVDVRHADLYAEKHLHGSLNIGLEGKFATWAGSLLDPERAVVVVAEPGREREALVRLARIGFDRVAGYLRDGMESVRDAEELTGDGRRVEVNKLPGAVGTEKASFILDVRSTQEFSTGAIPGAFNIPLPELAGRSNEIPRDRKILVYCASGYRSSTAASMLRKAGFTGVTDLAGGIQAWQQAGEPASVAS